MADPPSPFPPTDSIYKVSRKIKRQEQSLYNSLRSIYDDSLFLGEIRRLWPELPLLANLRCGLWYSPDFDGTCYFKSTDGHTGNWSFNPTRLNMHVANLAAQRGGCFIVDATRRGKRFPDSMSKTIPIWACVLNRAVYRYLHDRCTPRDTEEWRPVLVPLENCKIGTGTDPQVAAGVPTTISQAPRYQDLAIEKMDEAANHSLIEPYTFGPSPITATGDCSNQIWDCSLHLPLWVSKTEKESIERRIEEWVKLLIATGADLASLVQTLKKPLRPLWISQKTVIWLNEVPDATSWTFTPIILVSASQPIPSAQRMSDGDFSWSYIPGAADDEESWARGLTPALFWKHALDLINGGPDDCNRKVADMVERERVYRAYRGLEAEQVRVKLSKKTFADGEHDSIEIVQALTVTTARESYNSRSSAEALPGKRDTDLSQLLKQLPKLHWIGETRLAVGNAMCGQSENLFELVDCAINCGVASSLLSSAETSFYLYLPVLSSKHDRFSLQNHLSSVVVFARQKLKQGKTILIFCSDGEDLSVCVCLTILLAVFDGRGAFDNGSTFSKVAVSKWDVRQRLVYLCNYVPNARPSRGSLRQVYNYLTKILEC